MESAYVAQRGNLETPKACKKKLLRKDRHTIPPTWLLRPECDIITKRKNRAVLWHLAQLVTFTQEDYHVTPLVVLTNYVRMQKERLYNHPRR
jgi:hypothetical protein